MRTFHLVLDGAGAAKLEALALPFALYGATAADRDRERAPGPEATDEYRTVRLIARPAGLVENTATIGHRRLLFIVSGSVELTTAYMAVVLNPGDVVFVDDLGSSTGVLTYNEDTRIVDLEVSDQWAPGGVVPPAIEEPDVVSKIVEIYVADERANFRDADGLFNRQEAGKSPESVLGASFLAFSPDLLSDWHTETEISIVVVLSGGFELEVGGVGGEEVLRAGDVCLVDDRSGQGHITRTHGETRIVAIKIPSDHRWA